jgi:ABC-type Zn uptake system ZnuABC Zn-binding protein ZnuA
MMKRTAVILALALGLATQGAMAKTLNVVSSFSVLGDMVQQVGANMCMLIRWWDRTAIRIPLNLRRRIALC